MTSPWIPQWDSEDLNWRTSSNVTVDDKGHLLKAFQMHTPWVPHTAQGILRSLDSHRFYSPSPWDSVVL